MKPTTRCLKPVAVSGVPGERGESDLGRLAVLGFRGRIGGNCLMPRL